MEVGMTFRATGGATIMADSVKFATGDYRTITAVPMSSLANASVDDTGVDFSKINPTFRQITAGSAGVISQGAIGATGNIVAGGNISATGNIVAVGNISAAGVISHGAIGATGTLTVGGKSTLAGASFSNDVEFATGFGVSGATFSDKAPITLETNGTVAVDGTITANYMYEQVPHMHGAFMYVKMDVDSNTGSTSTLGQDITSASNLEITKSIPIGGAVDANDWFSYTIATIDVPAPAFNVAGSLGVYKITANLVVANTATNPTMTLNIKRNGTAVHTVVNKSYVVIDPQSITMEWFGATRGSWPFTVDVSTSTGNVTIKAGSTMSIVRIA
tara:strand:- start:9 stop:1004 length:996 start_codon:yes stop_codon:yes gene_type:complete